MKIQCNTSFNGHWLRQWLGLSLVNPLVPKRCGSNFKFKSFLPIIEIDIWNISHVIPHRTSVIITKHWLGVTRMIRHHYFFLTHGGRDKMAVIFQHIFLNENGCILIKISLKFVPQGPINNIPWLSLMTHICITRPEWVNHRAVLSTFQFLVLKSELLGQTRLIQCKPDISRLVGSKQWYRDISESAIYRATVMSPNQAPFTSALWAIMGFSMFSGKFSS